MIIESSKVVNFIAYTVIKDLGILKIAKIVPYFWVTVHFIVIISFKLFIILFRVSKLGAEEVLEEQVKIYA